MKGYNTPEGYRGLVKGKYMLSQAKVIIMNIC